MYLWYLFYLELCYLFKLFWFVDVWFCMVSVCEWCEYGKLKFGLIIKVIILIRLLGLFILFLFGEYCSGDLFFFDEMVLKLVDLEVEEKEL